MRRLRILQVITSMAGGAGLHAYQLTKHLDPARFEVRLAFAPGYPLDQTVRENGLDHGLLRWNRGLNPIATVHGCADLARELRARDWDIVHSHCSLAGAAGRGLATCLTRARRVFTVHVMASRDRQPAWRKRLLLEMERALDRHTDDYVVSTKEMARQLESRRITTPGKIRVIPLGIELPPAPDRAMRDAARYSLGLNAGDEVIAAAGRFEQQKGLIYLIRALPSLLRQHPRTKLLLFGDGPLRGALVRESKALGVAEKVRFPGWRTDLQSLLQGCDVFCLPSLWESFGYVLLEAMAAEVPIVASAVDGVPEVTEGARTALLVPPADPGALASALSSLLDNPAWRQSLAATGRARVESHFTLAGMIGRAGAFYEAVAGQPRGARPRDGRD